MMKARSSRTPGERTTPGVTKSEVLTNNVPAQRNATQLSNNQQTSAQAIRKRRSSINVYDQPSSLNSRLRQLETDMLRLDEDRTKLFDDTHSALAQYELRLNEIHAILKSRQDNVEKYVEDMKSLLLAKEEFEKQAKLLNEKHDRIHEKFMHRETTISREIKLLKNKFEALEKNRQFRSILQKSSAGNLALSDNINNEDFNNNLADLNDSLNQKSGATSEAGSLHLADKLRNSSSKLAQNSSSRDGLKAAKLSVGCCGCLYRIFNYLLHLGKRHSNVNLNRQWNNRVSSLTSDIELQIQQHQPQQQQQQQQQQHVVTGVVDAKQIEEQRNSEKPNQHQLVDGINHHQQQQQQSIELENISKTKEDNEEQQQQEEQSEEKKLGLFKRLLR